MNFFSVFLLVYFTLAVLMLALFRFLAVKKEIGKSPSISLELKTAHGLIAFYCLVLTMLGGIIVIVHSLIPQFDPYLMPIEYLDLSELKYAGVAVMVIAFVLIFLAQHQMRNSWRFGIDAETKTQLITKGIFSLSRNPIYLGMLVMVLGFFFVLPAAATLLLLALTYVLLQVQVRLEEEFLSKMQGQEYLDYMKKVRRWI